jgi:peptidoglycan hydrolase CwlO-like protein
MSIELTILISVVSVAFAVYAGINNMKRNSTADIKKDAVEMATINVKLDTIGRGVDDIKLEQKTINKDIKDLSNRVLKVEESAKSAHHRIDDIIERS